MPLGEADSITRTRRGGRGWGTLLAKFKTGRETSLIGRHQKEIGND